MSRTAASPHFPCETCDIRDKAICAALDDTELRELNAITTAVSLPARQTVFCEGDESAYLFNVVSGAIRLSKVLSDGRRQVTGFLFPGDFLGLSIADHYAYTADALTDTSLCRFERARLTRLLERFPKLERRLLELASNELVQAQDHLMLLGRKTATERLASLLVQLLERIGQTQGDGGVIDLPMSREDLADYAGLTTETVSRTMTRLRKQGVIEIPNTRSVRIPRAERLEALAGDY